MELFRVLERVNPRLRFPKSEESDLDPVKPALLLGKLCFVEDSKEASSSCSNPKSIEGNARSSEEDAAELKSSAMSKEKAV
jgi:hypothetical protein